MPKGMCTLQVEPAFLADLLCLPNGVEVAGCLVDTQSGELFLHLSGVGDELDGKKTNLTIHKQVDRTGRYILTGELNTCG